MKKKELTDKDITKAGTILDNIVVKQKNPIIRLIEENLNKIDELQKQGASLKLIYNELNKELNLGITYASFSTYVYSTRKKLRSELYSPRKSSAVKAASAVKAVNKENWNCEQCKNSVAKKYGERTIFVCNNCKTAYEADKNGKISSTKFSG